MVGIRAYSNHQQEPNPVTTYFKRASNLLTGGFMTTALLLATSVQASQQGKASWYAMTSLTASGERASPHTMTAAHRTLRFGTHIKVTNLRNGRSVVLCVNDRGPFVRGRVVDVTKKAARKLGFLRSGWTNVRLDVTKKKTRGCV
jgi:rare lipoprotein A